MQNNKSLIISIAILTLSILISSIWLGYSIQKPKTIITNASNNAMTLSQLSDYLGMSEDEIKGIIKTEEKTLKSTGQAQIFPHFIVNEKMYFNKQQVDQWLKETQLSPQSLIQLKVL